MGKVSSLALMAAMLCLGGCLVSEAPIREGAIDPVLITRGFQAIYGESVRLSPSAKDPERLDVYIRDEGETDGWADYPSVRFLEGHSSLILEIYDSPIGYMYGVLIDRGRVSEIYFYSFDLVIDSRSRIRKMDRVMGMNSLSSDRYPGVYQIATTEQVERGTFYAMAQLGLEPLHTLPKLNDP